MLDDSLRDSLNSQCSLEEEMAKNHQHVLIAMGVLLCILIMSPKALFRGKKINEVYSPRAMQLANKVCVYFALAGIAFAAGWTYHTLELLEQYSYVYSKDLTKITPTGFI
ncbi:hypothetical protein ACXA2F_002330 [Vibrio cholerae]|uniref:hypothetical protein n=1 Tax=Vibrio TaxID=662 RepID=UPI00273929C6|nr:MULTISPECIES: hypothetical protein [Vibrio]MDP4491942.1 hypothetical protein [Vibrio sp. AH4]MDV2306802.1 hypothetical protein [Vibrio cholerae]